MNTEITRLQKLIAKHTQAIYKIQEACNHPKETLSKKNGADTGNYDPSYDCYWTDFHCLECNKRWRGEQ